MENNKTAWIIVAVVAFFLLFVMPWGSGRFGGLCGMMNNYYGSSNYSQGMMGGWGGAWFGGIFMLVVLVALILLIVWLVKQLQQPKHTRHMQGRK